MTFDFISKRKSNRNPVKQIFITFPQSGEVDKVALRDALLRFDPEYYCIAKETHEDGNPHLHAIIKCKNSYSTRFVINYFKEKYPNDYKRIDVDPVRSIKHAIEYLHKEDEDPLTTGEFTDTRNPQRSWRNKFISELGYDSIDNLIRATDKQRDLICKIRKDLLLKLTDHMFISSIRNPLDALCDMLMHLDYKYLKIALQILEFDNTFLNFKELKHDITFLLKDLDINLKLNYAGDF